MNDRVVIFSDTHLGAPGRGAGSAEALRPLWKGAARVIINGDAAELTDPDWRVVAARSVMRIQELCEQDGVELVMLSGNHDPLVDDRRFLKLYDNQVFVTHGDMLHPAISPWTSYAGQLRALHEHALACLGQAETLDLAARLGAVQHTAWMKWEDMAAHRHTVSGVRRMLSMPPKVVRVLWYWATMPRRAAKFAAENAPWSRFFIFGHYHRTGIWRFGERTIINTGCFGGVMPPSAVVIEGGRMEVRGIWHDGREYQLSGRAKARYWL